jgi:hypothetical protein
MSFYALLLEKIKTDFKDDFKQIGGTLDFSALRDGQVATPSVFVMPITETASPNERINGISQNVKEEVAVVIAIRAPNDRSGFKANDELLEIRETLRLKILGWEPFERGAVEFVRGDLVDIENGYVWWRDVYQTNGYIFA